MKERPILFNTEMVKAEQDGKKTQTRRTIGLDAVNVAPEMWRFIAFNVAGQACFESDEIRGVKISCPYGQKGDRLWVRERFCVGAIVAADHHPEESEPLYIEQCKGQENIIPYEYATRHGIGIEGIKWKPSIHMPRSACRTVLEIVDVRIERIQDIKECDADAEGIHREWDGCHYWYKNYIQNCLFKGHPSNRASHSFFTLWESINGKRGMGWEVNPWVWVVEFKRDEKGEINE